MLDQTRGAAPASYSLQDPLPSAVVHRPSERWLDYRQYPVFSLPWLKRRSAIFVPAAMGVGLLQALAVGAVVNDGSLTLLTAVVSMPIWALFVLAGPALATFVRHRGWPLAWERPAVVAAIASGIGLGFAGQLVADLFSRTILLPHVLAAVGYPHPYKPTPLVIAIELVWLSVLLSCLGGVPALRSYFSEQQRWREALREQELESLRRQKGEADLRFAVLQAQVEPHFLFNTLASVHSLIRQDPARAEATVEALVDHLRATMPKLRAGIGQSYSTLAEQLEVCESYLKVMQVRMGTRLGYVRDVPAALLPHPFPPLMLISLVENAIKHGIEPKPTGGTISLCATVEDRGVASQLAVSVIDDGVGLKPGIGKGVGLENIRAQLAARFGAYGELYVRPRLAGGVTATVRVPCVAVMP